MAPNEIVIDERRRLGRLPHKSTLKALQFSDFFKYVNLPKKTGYWARKKPMPLRTFGNDQYGDCTRAKQAYAIMRMERLEARSSRYDVEITDEEVIRVYTSMSDRLYGGGDNGAYEDDALNEWRNPETTIRDTKGHPYTIDAYLAINAKNPLEMRAAMALSASKGIPFCINLPQAFSRQGNEWDIPEGQSLTGEWMPGSWGGHSMWEIDYDPEWIYVDSTWAEGITKISWRAVAAYVDEAHLVIDSVNAWKKKATPAEKKSLNNVIDAVNAVSSITIGK